MSILSRFIDVATSEGVKHVGDFIDKAGKTSLVTGPASMAVSEFNTGFTIAQYAAMASIVVSIMWFIKLGVDILISVLKYRRGD